MLTYDRMYLGCLELYYTKNINGKKLHFLVGKNSQVTFS